MLVVCVLKKSCIFAARNSNKSINQTTIKIQRIMETCKLNNDMVDGTMDSQNGEQPKEGGKKKVDVRSAAVVGGSGILMGALSAFLTASSLHHSTEEPAGNEQPAEQTNQYADETIHMASGVRDEMSFNEAFAAARAEVGPGGAFEWRGHVYGTYYGTEWESMTEAERAEYESHFSWASGHHADTGSDHVAQDDSSLKNEEVIVNTGSDDDGEVIMVEAEEEESTEGDGDVSVVVAHDPELDMNVAVLSDGESEMRLFDVDNDNTFDVLGVDANGNGYLEADELTNIEEYGVTVDDLGGFTTDSGEALALE